MPPKSSGVASTLGNQSDNLQSVEITLESVLQMEEQAEKRHLRRRHVYSKEFKLAAIKFWHQEQEKGVGKQTTAKKLRITAKMLRYWVHREPEIRLMKQGQCRASAGRFGQFRKLENFLYEKSLQFYGNGVDVSHAWLVAEAKGWYEREYPERVQLKPGGQEKIYEGFLFSRSWFTKFKKRKGIVLTY